MTSDRLIAGRYRLSDPIGTGAMGVVWKATDVRLQRTVAVKQLRLDPGLTPSQAVEARARAMREGRIAARLHHPNAITVFDVAEEDGRPWLVMEFMDAPSLAARISGGRTLPPMEVARIGAQAAAALAAAHKAGILHRDVKPGNLLVADDGTVKITDFGISRAVGDVTVTATGFLAGTPAYLAPEVARGEDGEPASDVFALGSTLYAAVTGSPPFGEGDNPLAVLHAVARGQVQPPQHAGALGPVLMQLLAPTPEARPTMRQAAEVLEGVAVGRPASVLPPGGYPRTAVLAGPGGTTVLPDPNRFGGPPPNDPRSVPPGPRVNAFRPAYGPGSGAPGAYGPVTPGYGPGTPGFGPGGSGHSPGTPGYGPGTPGSAPGFEPGAPGSGPAQVPQGPLSGPAPDGGQRGGGANSVPAAGGGSSSASGASGSKEVAGAQAKGSGEAVELSKRDGAIAGAAVGAASASKLGDAGSTGGKAADAAASGSEASGSGADDSAAIAGSAAAGGPAAGSTSADAGTADAGSAASGAPAAGSGGPGATPAPATTANLGTTASSDAAPGLGTATSSDSAPNLGTATSSDSAPSPGTAAPSDSATSLGAAASSAAASSGPAPAGPAHSGSRPSSPTPSGPTPSDTPTPDPTTALPYTPDYAAFAAAARPAPTPLEYTPPRRDPAAGKRLQLTALGAIAVAVIVLAGVLIALIANGTGDEQQAAPPPPPSTSAPAPTTEAPTTTQPPTSNAPAPQNGPPTPEQQAQFVQGYYGMLPGDINGAWAQLSPGYQAQTGGFGAYSQFWSTIRGVRVGAVTPSGPDTVVANLTYTLAGGGTSSENRWFRVSSEGGRFVISGSGL
ncbi:protein kinase [Nocardia sp. NPDC050697]|uniref:protein kinase domain-containing protein n=1 Tax=Nocardia sp. NPDC050697 TaxID=3155158 RepID=UPI00340CE76E